jgi:hypothetical protein
MRALPAFMLLLLTMGLPGCDSLREKAHHLGMTDAEIQNEQREALERYAFIHAFNSTKNGQLLNVVCTISVGGIANSDIIRYCDIAKASEDDLKIAEIIGNSLDLRKMGFRRIVAKDRAGNEFSKEL